jgi:uncharacterized protein (DUF2062 family)
VPDPDPGPEPKPTTERSYGPRLPEFLARRKRWLAEHHMTLMTMADTPHSIALGSAIGIFFGFTPLWSLKTLLSIAVAWIFRCNKVAAAIAVTLHDVILPLMPAIYYWQYRVGMVVLHGRTEHPALFRYLHVWRYLRWNTFSSFGLPLLVGSLFLAIPSAIVVYFVVRMLVTRARAPRETR